MKQVNTDLLQRIEELSAEAERNARKWYDALLAEHTEVIRLANECASLRRQVAELEAKCATLTPPNTSPIA